MMRSVLLVCMLWAFAVNANSNATSSVLRFEKITADNHDISLLEVSPAHYRIQLYKTPHHVYSPLSRISRRHDAIAAINGGFFHQDNSPAGILKIGSQWYGFNHLPRAAIGWQESGHVEIDQVTASKDHHGVSTTPKHWVHFENIVQGTPLLIQQGVPVRDHSREITISDFREKRHARTAVCILNNHNWLFIVAGHTKQGDVAHVQKPVQGFTIAELTDFLLSRGCVNALNLDGGNSAEMIYQQIPQNPHPGDRVPFTHWFVERSLSDALLILPR